LLLAAAATAKKMVDLVSGAIPSVCVSNNIFCIHFRKKLPFARIPNRTEYFERILREFERVYNISPELVRSPTVVMSLQWSVQPAPPWCHQSSSPPPAVSTNRLAKRPWHISYGDDVVRPGTVALIFVSSDVRQRRCPAGPLEGFQCFSSPVSTFFFPAC
jgi:hypothetical protein